MILLYVDVPQKIMPCVVTEWTEEKEIILTASKDINGLSDLIA